MKYNTFDLLKNIFKVFLILSVFSMILIFITRIFYNREIDNVKAFINDGTKVLYISQSKYYSEVPTELFKKYDIEYIYLNISNYTKSEIRKLKKITGNVQLKNSIILFSNGKKVDLLVNYKAKSQLIEFFQSYNLIPEIVGKNDNIIDSVKDYIKEDYLLLYVPYEYSGQVEEQDKILKRICEEYNIEYRLSNAYLLSNKQKEKLNNILQISDVNNQIVILIRENKIYSSIRNVYDEDEYLKQLYDNGFILDSNALVDVDNSSFEKIVSSEDKNVIFISKSSCKECDDIKETLNNISNNYGIKIYLMNIADNEDDNFSIIQEKMLELGFDNNFSIPIVIVTESNKILNYAIGNFREDYIKELFLENGVLKGE